MKNIFPITVLSLFTITMSAGGVGSIMIAHDYAEHQKAIKKLHTKKSTPSAPSIKKKTKKTQTR